MYMCVSIYIVKKVRLIVYEVHTGAKKAHPRGRDLSTGGEFAAGLLVSSIFPGGGVECSHNCFLYV